MTKASISLQELRGKIYRKAKTEKQWRFWGLYCHICKKEVLREAYRLAKANDGAPGIDGKSFEDIEAEGVEGFLEGIGQELLNRAYRPLPNRKVEIPKGNGKTRMLGIPTVKDRVVQGALKLLLEPIFEADFKDCSYGYRPKRHAHQAIDGVTKGILHGLTRVVDVDLSGYFDNIRHHILLEKIARRVQDDDIMHLVKLILKANGEKGVPQGGIISPLLSNLYLNEVDEMMERAREVTRRSGYYNLEFIRSADDMVILIHGHPKENWLIQKVQKRLKEELDKLQVQMNREKTKVVNLKEGGCFSFLGFDFRLTRNREGKTYVSKTPRKKKRQEIGKKIKVALKANWNKPLKEVIQTVNAIIRGWVNYFRIGNSNSTFSKVRNYLEMKVRKFVMRRKKLKGFGWRKWSREEIYGEWGLYNDYRIRYVFPKTNPSR
ncbi:MAG: group II intron reverse transcriptase/maturase [Candidatus Brocadia sp.]|nr:group II intron reverse transcriptase/maturase [Candidatus Brocadia sp.]MDG6026147.1 group II intron reverse transcriptase/maturase [Candidatus Brocadia sp.]TVL95703.1 MAG: group II intron reverse transcriptase/maturase [Candidatus Brocadia sp. WS118]